MLNFWPTFLVFVLELSCFFAKLLEIENYGKKTFGLIWPQEHIFPLFDHIQNGSSFYNIHPRIKCLT